MSATQIQSRAKLTQRELEVLGAVCLGLSSKQIAVKLGLRPATVDAYIEHVRLKLVAINRCHMVAIALSLGLCQIEAQGDRE